ncbi:hypothetical protein QCA50_003173 [Cerrena zonata]|uniref:Nucleolus and neural progenitor protein-like N-terminal domain-containing protein n=1 Tax=Cerrena zonata TaxID=2478898 RepID=A0AAW0GRD7_9APHY
MPDTSNNIVCAPRSGLKPADQTAIDSILKDLKICTRRLNVAFLSQQTELQVLERLFYKGKNQHRSALFWRRIEETRRYALRLTKQDIRSIVDGLRVSFWGPINDQTAKRTKGAWTHSPDPKSVELILERLLLVHKLILKMHGTLQRTYDHLNLNLQTGAFLQLILTLSAIISRLAALCDELCLSIEFTWEVCYRLLHLFDPARVKRIRPLFKDRPAAILSCKVDMPHTTPSEIADVFEDDVGSSIPRTSLSDPTTDRPQNTISSDKPNTCEDDVVHINPSFGLNFVTPHNHNVEAMETKPAIVRRNIDRASLQDDTTNPDAVTQLNPSHSEETKRPKKKIKKKKRDEIDDIFGF